MSLCAIICRTQVGRAKKCKTKGLGFEPCDFALELLDGLFFHLLNFILGIANKRALMK